MKRSEFFLLCGSLLLVLPILYPFVTLTIAAVIYLLSVLIGVTMVNYLSGDSWFRTEYLIEEIEQQTYKNVFHIRIIFYFLWMRFDLGRKTESVEDLDYSGSQEVTFWSKAEAQKYIDNGFLHDYELNKLKTTLHKTK